MEAERIGLGYNLDLDDQMLLVVGSGPEYAGWLLAVSGDTWEKIDPLDSGGIAIAENRLYRLLSSRSNGTGTATGELLAYDLCGVVQYRRIDCLDDPHALIAYGKHLITPCPAVNSIFWLDLDGEVKRTWKAPGTDDAWHLNGVHMHQGRLYASAFGRFDAHYGWSREMDAPAGMIFDVENQDDVATGLCCPHDPLHVDGGWLVCDSRRGDLLFIDDAGSVVRRVHLGGWTRGLAVTERYILVGVSAERYYSGTPGRGTLVVLDRYAWSVLARIAMPCMEMQMLVLVPREFLAALRLGFRTNATRVIAQDREDMFHSLGNIRSEWDFTRMEPLLQADRRCTIRATAPSEVAAGHQFPVAVEVTNCGSGTMLTVPPHPVHLGCRWRGPEVQANQPRFALQRALAPGGKLNWEVNLTAPSVPGSYELAFTLVQEWVAWFDELDDASGCTIRLNVQEGIAAAGQAR